MSAEQNKAIVRQIFEAVWNTGDLSLMEAHPGLHEIMPTVQRAIDAGIGKQPSFMEIIGEGEWVAVRMLNDLPQTGEFMGAPATGGKMEIIQLVRVVDGVIVKQHSQAGQVN